MKAVWNFLEKATRADIRLAELEHPYLKKILSFCFGRIPIYVHPSFYRSLKLQYPLDVRGVSIVNFVFAGDEGRLVVADVAVKSFKFWVVAVYASNSVGERRFFFRQLQPFLDDLKWIILVGDWNAIFDPKID